MGDISAFVGNISQQRLAKKNRYKIKVSGPIGNALPALTMMCESISFPGQNVRSVPDTLRYGPAREHAQGMTYGPFTATFICSSDLAEKVYFEDWQSQIINQINWNVRYYDSYKGSLEITQLDINNNPTYAIKVEEAYPKTILAQDMGYAQVNAYQTIGVEFTYRYWAPVELPESGYDIPESDYGTMAADWDPNTGSRRYKKSPYTHKQPTRRLNATPTRMPGDVRTHRNTRDERGIMGSKNVWRHKEKALNKQRRNRFFSGT